MMRKTGVLVLAVTVICSVLSGAVAQPPEPSLPPNLKIEPPLAGVSPRLAQLSGIWEGVWTYDREMKPGGTMKLYDQDATGWGLKIAILEINPPNVKAIFARPEKFFQVREASVAGDSIVLKWGKPGKKRTLTLSPTSNPKVAEAKLEREGKDRVLKAKLQKK